MSILLSHYLPVSLFFVYICLQTLTVPVTLDAILGRLLIVVMHIPLVIHAFSGGILADHPVTLTHNDLDPR